MRACLIVLAVLALLATSSCGLGFFFSPHPFGSFLTQTPPPDTSIHRAPVITSVTPMQVYAGLDTSIYSGSDEFAGYHLNWPAIQLASTGGTADSYAWDMGALASPSVQNGWKPAALQLNTPGDYPVSLTATNVWGQSEKYEFTLTVLPLSAPHITGVAFYQTDGLGSHVAHSGPLTKGALYGVDLQYSPKIGVDGNPGPWPVVTWTLNSGLERTQILGGAWVVEAKNGGTYDASVRVDNSAGSDTYDFDYKVSAQ